MNTRIEEGSKTDPKPQEWEVTAKTRGCDLDTTARHHERVFSEGHKTKAIENPEAGCVPWYHFPDVPK
jgi:hypothetical protein